MTRSNDRPGAKLILATDCRRCGLACGWSSARLARRADVGAMQGGIWFVVQSLTLIMHCGFAPILIDVHEPSGATDPTARDPETPIVKAPVSR